MMCYPRQESEVREDFDEDFLGAWFGCCATGGEIIDCSIGVGFYEPGLELSVCGDDGFGRVVGVYECGEEGFECRIDGKGVFVVGEGFELGSNGVVNQALGSEEGFEIAGLVAANDGVVFCYVLTGSIGIGVEGCINRSPWLD